MSMNSATSEISFTKMHGCGNDFIILCHRRFGIGADQLLTVSPSSNADFKMEIYNADGSQVEMCGNGIRCFAKYVVTRGLTKKKALNVETLAGIMRPRLVGERVEVDMGEPVFEGRKIPVKADGKVLDYPLKVNGTTYPVSCVSMGNPHCVLFLNEIENLDLTRLGPQFEHHPFFPNRVNTEFANVIGAREVKMRVWERGAGETWACGTGACAVAVVGALTGKTGREVTVHLLGGDLLINWRDDNHVYMTGEAKEVFEGSWKIG